MSVCLTVMMVVVLLAAWRTKRCTSFFLSFSSFFVWLYFNSASPQSLSWNQQLAVTRFKIRSKFPDGTMAVKLSWAWSYTSHDGLCLHHTSTVESVLRKVIAASAAIAVIAKLSNKRTSNITTLSSLPIKEAKLYKWRVGASMKGFFSCKVKKMHTIYNQ